MGIRVRTSGLDASGKAGRTGDNGLELTGAGRKR